MSSKLWFSIFDFSFDYKGAESSFVDVSNEPWAKDFQLHFESVKEELSAYLKHAQATTYFNTAMTNEAGIWKTISLRWWDVEFFKNQKDFPVVTKLLRQYPQILSLSFNQLAPNGKILPHCGDTNGIFRCHFGITVPAGLPKCGFRVRTEMTDWKEGEWFGFMDAYQHEAFNLTEQERVIMVVDVLRPEFQSERKKIVSTVLTSVFLQRRAMYLPFLRKVPPTFIYLLARLLRPFAWWSLKWNNLMKRY
jgi:aspartyl/asparaginyl beta-hydroxylase (cupin superfamily)